MVNPLEKLNDYTVVLASGSPRRRELLGMLGIEFVQTSVDVEEKYPRTLAPEQVPEYLSRLKAGYYREHCQRQGEIVITADTVVVAGCEVLGKPADAADVRAMLHKLSGCTHKVVTGITVSSDTLPLSTISAETEVEFAPLDEDEIDYYIERYRPMDKAGAYGIQEWIGCIGIRRINGSYYNVMGLPLYKLYVLLRQLCNTIHSLR